MSRFLEVLETFAEAGIKGEHWPFDGGLHTLSFLQAEEEITAEDFPRLEAEAVVAMRRAAAERELRYERVIDIRERRSSQRQYVYTKRYLAKVMEKLRTLRRASVVPIIPIRPLAVSPCPCGGCWELRPGCKQFFHVGVRSSLCSSPLCF